MLGRLQDLINNTRIAAKLWVAPLLITLSMIGMSVADQYGARQQSAALDEIIHVAYAKGEATDEAMKALASGHVDLYRMISWLANAADAQKALQEGTKRLDVALIKATARLGELGDKYTVAGDEKAAADAVQAALKAYSASVKDVMDMVAVDAATALTFMTDADEKYRTLSERLAVLHVVEKRIADDTAAAAAVAATQTTQLSLAILVAALALAALVTIMLARLIARPIGGMTQAMVKLAGGDKSVAVPGVGRGDEIGRMADAVQVFKESMLRADALLEEQRAEQAQKEVRQHTIEGYLTAFDSSVSGSLGTLAEAADQLRTTSQSMTHTAEETQRQVEAAGTASSQASANVHTVASAAEELSSSIGEIGRQVMESARIASRAVEDAGQTNGQVQALAAAAQRIGDVVQLINDIAGQTNLLALNATIEAARAGDAGKGFAVVASEVKSLATQTAKATEDISAQVSAIQGATGDAVRAIETITGTISRINEIATAIASAVEEQGAATQEIARNVQEASTGTGAVSENIAGVSASAARTGEASSQVLSAAGELARQGETLRGEVSDFLAKIRAA
jgi:methyl-accepting chemotaxis protein